MPESLCHCAASPSESELSELSESSPAEDSAAPPSPPAAASLPTSPVPVSRVAAGWRSRQHSAQRDISGGAGADGGSVLASAGASPRASAGNATAAGGGVAVAGEQPVEQEPRQLPAEARATALRHVERHLVAERPVELRLERVQHEVDLEI